MRKEETTHCYRIAENILARIRGTEDGIQAGELDRWLSASPNNKKLYEDIMDPEKQAAAMRQLVSIDTPRGWYMVQKRVAQRRRQRLFGVLRVAAVFALLVGGGLFFHGRLTQHTTLVSSQNETILPGYSQARIIFAGGNSVFVDSLSEQEGPRKLEGAVVENHGKEVKFFDVTKDLHFMHGFLDDRYTTIEVPAGGEYKITLMDGTVVFLNSKTQLRFPENYSQMPERTVYLSGEAFFQVARDERKPFVVMCGNYSVRVLGTSFNISNYEEDALSKTTVITGNVAVQAFNKDFLLSPGQQAVVGMNDVLVKDVDVENYTSWMNANFRFNGMNIDEILKKVARWYAVDIVYKNDEVKNYHFTGFMPRYATIDEVLRLLSLTTDIKFEVNGRKVIVSVK